VIEVVRGTLDENGVSVEREGGRMRGMPSEREAAEPRRGMSSEREVERDLRLYKH
jgi:hypothetical protein